VRDAVNHADVIAEFHRARDLHRGDTIGLQKNGRWLYAYNGDHAQARVVFARACEAAHRLKIDLAYLATTGQEAAL
jgi:hypothetical protein